MSGLWFVVQLILWIFVILLAIVLILAAIILLVPIRYEATFSLHDPEPHDEAQWGMLRESARVRASCTWLGGLAAASVSWPEDPAVQCHIAWIRLTPGERRTASRKRRGKETESQQMRQGGIYDRIVRMVRKADYYLRVARKEETTYTIERVRTILYRCMRRLLPRTWQMHGTIGIGDPAATARILEILGILYPVLDGHVCIEPVFLQWQMDAAGSMRGQIRLLPLVTAALSIAMDRRIRLTIRRIRGADINIARHYERIAAVGQSPK